MRRRTASRRSRARSGCWMGEYVFGARIIPDSIYPHRKHPDIRIARRAATIASLARRISERSVKRGLRTTLLTQAKRLERLAEARLKDFPEGAEDEDQKED